MAEMIVPIVTQVLRFLKLGSWDLCAILPLRALGWMTPCDCISALKGLPYAALFWKIKELFWDINSPKWHSKLLLLQMYSDSQVIYTINDRTGSALAGFW